MSRFPRLALVSALISSAIVTTAAMGQPGAAATPVELHVMVGNIMPTGVPARFRVVALEVADGTGVDIRRPASATAFDLPARSGTRSFVVGEIASQAAARRVQTARIEIERGGLICRVRATPTFAVTRLIVNLSDISMFFGTNGQPSARACV